MEVKMGIMDSHHQEIMGFPMLDASLSCFCSMSVKRQAASKSRLERSFEGPQIWRPLPSLQSRWGGPLSAEPYRSQAISPYLMRREPCGQATCCTRPLSTLSIPSS